MKGSDTDFDPVSDLADGHGSLYQNFSLVDYQNFQIFRCFICSFEKKNLAKCTCPAGIFACLGLLALSNGYIKARALIQYKDVILPI